ncbi:hypothetical protein MA16_Dca026109 [Dendrobium catenatum]|uniref:Uncharacterized protein n=1 Tax=Dendrobium catenatum TaxID=906689 RepID=A0A2I0VYZ9_9ASPA|nr:hypothetical protein MA16_Dca026109 [Dendrobium catenatum]
MACLLLPCLDPMALTLASDYSNHRMEYNHEEGSSSRFTFISKNQRKNYLRRVRKKIAKARNVVPAKTLGQVEPEAAEEYPIPTSSPLLKGSHFYPLVAPQGEDRVASSLEKKKGQRPLKREGTATFDPDLDNLLGEEDETASIIFMV